MSSIYYEGDVCPRCGKRTLMSYYSYKTDEGYESCRCCGFYHSAFMEVIKETHQVKRVKRQYEMDGSIFLGLETLSKNITWLKPIFRNTAEEEITAFLNYGTERTIKEGISGIFLKENSSYKRILYGSDTYHMEKETFIIEEPVWKVTYNDGYGMLYMIRKGEMEDKALSVRFNKITPQKEAILLWDRSFLDDLDIQKSYLTIWDVEKSKIHCLKGHIPVIK